jgi:DNA-binding NarL/FixJ family response regulator
MVQKLADGKLYKQIAADFGLQVSTVRTHLYNTYRKLGVADRAQTVLLATENGWL